MPASTEDRDDAREAPVPVRAQQVVAASAAPIVMETKAVSTRALPKIQPFVLPLDELAQVAEGSGLHWVNSDSERVAQVRAAIAAEPKAVRVPRERPPAIVIDEGPLVLVETRRDLAGMVLPFEATAQDSGARP
jgi:ribonuclease E